MESPVASFLHPRSVRKSFQSYARVARRRNWRVRDKVRLYQVSAIAFDPVNPSQEAFEDIYQTLRSYWQVFRRGTRLPPGETFELLLSPDCHACRRGSLDLSAMTTMRNIEPVWRCVAAASRIKALSSGRVSPMAVSKFLHFFNPALFPIYDSAVVGNQALPVFREAIKASKARWRSRSAIIEDKHLYRRGLAVYMDYLFWAADCFAATDAGNVMGVFEEQLLEMLRAENAEIALPPTLNRQFATAFEFALIGASHTLEA